MTPETRERLYTPAEAGAIIGLDRSGISRYIKEGRLKAIRIGARWGITMDEIKRFAREPRGRWSE